MAGLYVVVGRCAAGRIESAAARLRYFADESSATVREPGFAAAWVGLDDPADWGPAYDPESGVHLLTSGRVALDEQEWRAADGIEELTGGTANRLLLRRYLDSGIAGIERHNGSACLVIHDPRDRRSHLLTDHFGYHPVYLYRSRAASSQVISTAPDAIADDPMMSLEIDEVSIVEFLSAWRTTPPHTYYRDVLYAGAARHWRFGPGGGESQCREYWRPFEQQPFATLEEAAWALGEALERSIRIRTLPRLAPVVLFAGGGLDSRAVLFAAADRSGLIALNLYDRPNRETAVARELCDRCGVRYDGFERDRDYYPRLLLDNVRISNGMGSLEDHHYLGARERVRELGGRTVMSACTADWLFKGYGLEKTYRRLLGRNLPLERLTRERVTAFLPNRPRPVPGEYAVAVRDRLEGWFADTPRSLTEERDWCLVEDRRVRPACYAVSVSGPGMYRMYPYDAFLADRQLADCYARMPAAWKLNSRVWGLTVKRLGGPAGGIADSSWGWRPGAGPVERLAVFARGWLWRRLAAGGTKVREGPATDGSWPDLGWYARHSRTLSRLWESAVAEHRDRIAHYWGADPWRRPLAEWAGEPHDLFRILTILCWLHHRSI